MTDPTHPAAIPPTAAARLAGAPRRSGLPRYTQAFYDARELALARMQGDAAALRADGVVGVREVVSSHIWRDHAVEFLAAGTAVRTFPLDSKLLSPTLVLSAAP
jgi:hypothetical protein